MEAERRLDEISAALGTLEDAARPALPGLVRELIRPLDAEVSLAYGFTREDDGLSVEFMYGAGYDVRSYRRDFEPLVRRTPVGWAQFNPLRPEPAQQNRVHSPPVYDPVHQGPYAAIAAQYPRETSMCQMRTLVCDRGTLLAWVGVLRNSPFTERERRRFRRILPTLRRRLQLERILGAGPLSISALDATLEALGAPAFLVRLPASIVHANSAAKTLLDRDRGGVLAALSGGPGPLGAPERMPICAPGVPPHELVVLRSPPDDVLARAAEAAHRWGLTPRETETLVLLARGDSNKCISSALGCTESTVELHVGRVLQKSGSDCRARLVAKFWTRT